jgi:hypothetical protein
MKTRLRLLNLLSHDNSIHCSVASDVLAQRFTSRDTYAIFPRSIRVKNQSRSTPLDGFGILFDDDVTSEVNGNNTLGLNNSTSFVAHHEIDTIVLSPTISEPQSPVIRGDAVWIPYVIQDFNSTQKEYNVIDDELFA